MFYLFGQYDPASKYNLDNLRKIYKQKITKENSGGICHNTQYMDAICDDRILRYITSNLEADEDSADYEFFEMIRDAAAKIVTLAEKKLR